MNKNNIITDWLDKYGNPDIENEVNKTFAKFERAERIAKKYCKSNRVKLEDIRGSFFIYSIIVKRRVGGKINGSDTTYKSYKDWDAVKHRTAFLCKVYDDGDVVHCKGDVGGKYHSLDTSFTITDNLYNSAIINVNND